MSNNNYYNILLLSRGKPGKLQYFLTICFYSDSVECIDHAQTSLVSKMVKLITLHMTVIPELYLNISWVFILILNCLRLTANWQIMVLKSIGKLLGIYGKMIQLSILNCYSPHNKLSSASSHQPLNYHLQLNSEYVRIHRRRALELNQERALHYVLHGAARVRCAKKLSIKNQQKFPGGNRGPLALRRRALLARTVCLQQLEASTKN